ncbi:MAG: PH domain-containing protein [Bacteroidales bacterium]|nr:PH domain-containing protein [Bacteroidales bacterium]MDD6141417.1 PH domain-containing protein [Bacteroidales bacterium]MDD6622305.1 PH domain-containing protein [Bacteroidales bacterium]MDD6668230.1 PH domain-containing protein [Bacteroidales bacterium]
MEVYKSKIDYRLVGAMYLITLVPTVPALFLAFSWTMVVLVLIMLAFASILIFNTKYIVAQETLSIKCGFLPVEKYDIRQIASIRSTNTIISAPAASLDRIEIRLTTGKSVVISPADKQKFIEHLRKINPNIAVS